MAKSSVETPAIHVELDISPASHSFTTQQKPPILKITLTSHSKAPITIVTWGTPFDARRALTNNGIFITDQDTDETVPTSQIMVQRSAIRRTRGTPDEDYFVTLEPNEPVTISTFFGRGDGNVRPQPKSIVQRGWELDEDGNELRIRRSKNATGVDGLEQGHRYRVGVNLELLNRCRWAFATKEDVLVDGSGEGSYLQDYPWAETVVDFHVSEAVLSVTQ